MWPSTQAKPTRPWQARRHCTEGDAAVSAQHERVAPAGQDLSDTVAKTNESVAELSVGDQPAVRVWLGVVDQVVRITEIFEPE
jgi:hypothetical protein